MKRIGLVLFLVLTSGCQDVEQLNNNRKKIVSHYVMAYNGFDVQGMTKHLDQHIVFENISNGKVDLKLEGLKAFKEQAETAKTYFDQRKQTIINWEFKGDIVTIEIDYEGILAVDFAGELKKGDTLKLSGSSQFQFQNGKIIRITDKS